MTTTLQTKVIITIFELVKRFCLQLLESTNIYSSKLYSFFRVSSIWRQIASTNLVNKMLEQESIMTKRHALFPQVYTNTNLNGWLHKHKMHTYMGLRHIQS
jgi:hypothetical protein